MKIMKKVLKWIWKKFVKLNKVILGFVIFFMLVFLVVEKFETFLVNRVGGERKNALFSMVISDMRKEPVLGVFFLVMFIIIPIIIVVINRGLDRRCTECKEWFALRVSGDNLIKCEDIQILTEVKLKDNYGHVVGTQEQYVPGTRKIYHKNYTCRKCGATSFRTYSKDEKNT